MAFWEYYLKSVEVTLSRTSTIPYSHRFLKENRMVICFWNDFQLVNTYFILCLFPHYLIWSKGSLLNILILLVDFGSTPKFMVG